MSPRRTFSQYKISYLRKRTVIDRFRKIVRYHRWIQRPGIILALLLIALAFLAMVQRRRGPKMRPHRVQQPEHMLPRLPEVYRIPITDTSRYSGYAAVVLSTVLANEWLRTIECLFCYCCHNCNHSTFLCK